MDDGRLGLGQRLAGLDPVVPRVAQFWVTSTPAVAGPRTAATAATDFPGFLNDAAFGACGTDNGRCRDCGFVCAGISE